MLISRFRPHLLRIGLLAVLTLVLTALATHAQDRLPFDESSPQIMVDQFGFLVEGPKVAIAADPVIGFNNTFRWEPGETFEVRAAASGEVVHSGTWERFNHGAVDAPSGDRLWWADFSSLQTPGTYVVVDVETGESSHPFDISDEVYRPVLRAAGRMFYYNRSAIAKEEQYAGRWVHGENHFQAAHAQLYDTEPRGNPRDVRGGWWDAGDYNKYSRFTSSALTDIMFAYETNPLSFTDDWNIPESGNCIPDMLDEAAVELRWLFKMQDEENGGVYNIAGTLDGSTGTPSGDPAQALLPWYYSDITTWSTAGFSGITAKASRVYEVWDPELSADLRAAAEFAWTYLEAHPEMLPAHGNDTANGAVGAGESQGGGGYDLRLRLWAAAELWRLTGEDKYEAYFLENHDNPASRHSGHHPYLQGRFDAHHTRSLQAGYLAYIQTEGADPEIVDAIRAAIRHSIGEIRDNYLNDGYRNYFHAYWWGSNMQRSFMGNLLTLPRLLNFPIEEQEEAFHLAQEYIASFHGRNPLNLVYLSNMGPEGASAGAERSVEELYHSWFHHETKYDGLLDEGDIGPAPGYLAGGPNPHFDPWWLVPPYGQPPAKSFLEFNTAWNAEHSQTENSWAITEPAIYYQTAYVRLVASLVPPFLFAPFEAGDAAAMEEAEAH